MVQKTQQRLVVILLGPPGSGKGSQAALLKEKLYLPHISTGDLLREEIAKKSVLGLRAKSYIDDGNLVPDPLILDMLQERTSQKDCKKGYILDGFPRTLLQAQIFQESLVQPVRLVVFHFSLSDKEIILRLSQRVICQNCQTPFHLVNAKPKVKGVCDLCGGELIQRKDDSEEIVKHRLKVYHEQTAPLIAYFSKQNLLQTIDCRGSKEKVLSDILSVLQG